jgi:ADP-heptose:LPS heptosyltransferase
MNLKRKIKSALFRTVELFLSFFGKENEPIEKDSVKKILIFEGGGIGDLLMLFPAINALAVHFGGRPLTFLAAPHARDVIEMNPYGWNVSEIFPYDIHVKHRSFFNKILMIYSLRRERFDLIYAPSRGDGMREVPLMVFIMGARYRMGFSGKGAGKLNTHRIAFSKDLPIAEQNIALMESAGIKVAEKDVRMRISEEISGLSVPFDFRDGCLISIHPCATWNSEFKTWPLSNFIELILKLLDLCSCSIILVGSRKETESGRKLELAINNLRLINAIGITSIPQMAAIISRSVLFIGNDSGPLHIASALKIPSIGLFGPTSPDQILSAGSSCLVIRRDLSCSPCYLHKADFAPRCAGTSEEGECMQFPAEDVISVVEGLLERNSQWK